MRGWLDFLFYNFRWYRRWQGGTWFKVRALPSIQGGFVAWVRFRPSCTHEVIEVENYGDCHGCGHVPHPNSFCSDEVDCGCVAGFPNAVTDPRRTVYAGEAK